MTEITFTEFAWTAAPIFISMMALWALIKVLGTMQEMREDHRLGDQIVIRTMIQSELYRMREDDNEEAFLTEIEKLKAYGANDDRKQTPYKL